MLWFIKQIATSTEVEEMAVAGINVTVVVEIVTVEMVATEADKITHIRQHHNLMQLCLLPYNMQKQW